MNKLIEALQIFLKYGCPPCPTHCEHDTLYVMGYRKEDISEEDFFKLAELGFNWSDSEEVFYSYRYGSC